MSRPKGNRAAPANGLLRRPSRTERNPRRCTLGVMGPTLFMMMLDNTVVNAALPSIQRDLGECLGGPDAAA